MSTRVTIGSHDKRRLTDLGVKNKFWSLQKVKIPDSNDTIGLVKCCGILVVRRDA